MMKIQIHSHVVSRVDTHQADQRVKENTETCMVTIGYVCLVNFLHLLIQILFQRGAGGKQRNLKDWPFIQVIPTHINTLVKLFVRFFFLTAQHRRNLQWSVRNCICVNQYLTPSHIHIILPVYLLYFFNFCLLQKPWPCFSKCSYQVIGTSIIRELHFNKIFTLFPHIEDWEAWI